MTTKMINLDKYRTSLPVKIGGVKYEVNQVSVKEFMDYNINEKLSETDTIKKLVNTIANCSDIPEDVLYTLDYRLLNALTGMVMGTVTSEEGVDDVVSKPLPVPETDSEKN